MAFKQAQQYFEQYGLADQIIVLEESSATVEEAAQALKCEPARIAKSLAFKIEHNVILVVTAGDVKIDNAKFKAQFHTKPRMLPFALVEEYVGHAVGGVCPFGIKEGIDVYLDDSLKRFDTVFPACGSSNSAIELSIDELDRYSNNITWINVCKTMLVNA